MPFHRTLTTLIVTDNADLIFQQRALDLILPKLAKVIKNLQEFAIKYKDMPALGFTHYQPASSPYNTCTKVQNLLTCRRPSSSPSVWTTPHVFPSLIAVLMLYPGKRAAQWIQELMMDLEDIETVRERLQFRGAQGTTGSQATFLELFEGNAKKIVELNEVRTNRLPLDLISD